MPITCAQGVADVGVGCARELYARWKVSLHEVGHAVAAIRLLGFESVRAFVFDHQQGAAYFDLGEELNSEEEAVAIAAGKAGELLAQTHPVPMLASRSALLSSVASPPSPTASPSPSPPSPPVPVPLTIAYPESVAPLLKQAKESPTDDVRLARWSIRYVESRPQRWMKNYYGVCRRAEAFVREHELEIVEAATRLFERGIVTVPVEPAERKYLW